MTESSGLTYTSRQTYRYDQIALECCAVQMNFSQPLRRRAVKWYLVGDGTGVS
jgi:hypothetical protein